MDFSHYAHLARLFDYPAADYRENLSRMSGYLAETARPGQQELLAFAAGLPEDDAVLGELFTRTFEVQGMTTMDVGYMLFGDDYKRAELLANLSREHQTHGVDCGRELADNLPNILRLLAVLQEGELRLELVREILVPGLLLMLRDFEPERVAQKNAHYHKHYKTLIEVPAGLVDAGIFRLPLQALLDILIADFQLAALLEQLQQWAHHPKTADFLGFVGKEIEIEELANPVNSGQDS